MSAMIQLTLDELNIKPGDSIFIRFHRDFNQVSYLQVEMDDHYQIKLTATDDLVHTPVKRMTFLTPDDKDFDK